MSGMARSFGTVKDYDFPGSALGYTGKRLSLPTLSSLALSLLSPCIATDAAAPSLIA